MTTADGMQPVFFGRDPKLFFYFRSLQSRYWNCRSAWRHPRHEVFEVHYTHVTLKSSHVSLTLCQWNSYLTFDLWSVLQYDEFRVLGGREYSGFLEGRVEVRLAGSHTWGVICGDQWNFRAAIVVCRHMGVGYARNNQTVRYGINDTVYFCRQVFMLTYTVLNISKLKK